MHTSSLRTMIISIFSERIGISRGQIIPAEGLPLIVTFAGEEDEVRESLGVEDVRIFASVGQQIKDVVQVMRGMIGKKEKLKIGVQMWFSTPAFLLNMFQRANPIVDVVDIALLWTNSVW